MKTWHMNCFCKKNFPIMIHVADMAILMSDLYNFDNDQISSKLDSTLSITSTAKKFLF